MGWIVFWIACGILAGFIASQKGHSFGLWIVIGCVGGVFAVIASMFLKENTDE